MFWVTWIQFVLPEPEKAAYQLGPQHWQKNLSMTVPLNLLGILVIPCKFNIIFHKKAIHQRYLIDGRAVAGQKNKIPMVKNPALASTEFRNSVTNIISFSTSED